MPASPPPMTATVGFSVVVGGQNSCQAAHKSFRQDAELFGGAEAARARRTRRSCAPRCAPAGGDRSRPASTAPAGCRRRSAAAVPRPSDRARARVAPRTPAPDGRRCAALPLVSALGFDAEAPQIFAGQIDAPQLAVFLHVANDVGELEGDAGLLGQLFGARDRDSRRCECRPAPPPRPRGSSSRKVDRRFRTAAADSRRLAASGCAGKSIAVPCTSFSSRSSGMLKVFCVSASAINTGSSVRSPSTTRRRAFIHSASFSRRCSGGNGGIVGDVVGVPHEGVHRRQGIALARRKHQESVVEILGRRARDVAADSVGSPQLQRVFAHSRFPSAARATSQSLRGLEMTGREFSTS